MEFGVGDGDEMGEESKRVQDGVQAAASDVVAEMAEYESVEDGGRGVTAHEDEYRGDVVEALVVSALERVGREDALDDARELRAGVGAGRGGNPVRTVDVEVDLVALARAERGGALLEDAAVRVRARRIQRQEPGPRPRARLGGSQARARRDRRELDDGHGVEREQALDRRPWGLGSDLGHDSRRRRDAK